MTVNKPKPPVKGRSAANPSNYSQLYKQSEQNVLQSTATAPVATVQTVVAPRTSEQVDWKTEYGYVFKDLRYLGIVSGVLFAVIVVLGFFL